MNHLISSDPTTLSQAYKTEVLSLECTATARIYKKLCGIKEQLNIGSQSKYFSDYIVTPRSNNSRMPLYSGTLVHKSDLSFLYYHFKNDDKYFLCSGKQTAYQDSNAYESFYYQLPSLSTVQHIDISKYGASIEQQSLVLMSRQQYGHFVYDDLLPVLSHILSMPKSYDNLILLYSCEWQIRATKELISITGISIRLITILLPKFHSILNIQGACFFVPQIPSALFTAFERIKSYSSSLRRLAWPSAIQVRVAYLSRKGFEIGRPRVVNREATIATLNEEYSVTCIQPHEYNERELLTKLSTYEIAIAEPGTLPLIGGLLTPLSTRLINLLSRRCLLDCEPKYVYSGWRYHVPFIEQTEYIWCQPCTKEANPFSDQILVPTEWLKARICL